MKTNPFRAAFTLIELLAVISIIAILAGLSMQGINNGLFNAKLARASSDARQVGIGLRLYAQDHDGGYPASDGFSTSNDALRELFPAYLQAETVCAVSRSAVGKHADNRIEPASRVLERGENHWAYIEGLTDTTNALWPLLVDHTDGSGHYTDREGERGGTWTGKKAVVIRCDQSASIVVLNGSKSHRYIPRHDDPDKNALSLGEYMGGRARLLEPAK
jgi:prepilin-type N-terminal cleavage/methylation domain-containing protein